MNNLPTDGLKKMRAPFPDHQVSKMCRSTKKDNAKGQCKRCGGYHGLPAIQLEYVGHAALTDRLLDADPNWTWEPLAYSPDGSPLLDRDGGMWIKLTVCGVTRLGYGDAQGKTGGDATKERIGDALRNAAMRFGAALDLWHKGELHIEEPEPKNPLDKFSPVGKLVEKITPEMPPSPPVEAYAADPVPEEPAPPPEVLPPEDAPTPAAARKLAMIVPGGEVVGEYATPDEWVAALVEMIGKVVKSTKYPAREKMTKLREMREANETVVHSLSPEQKAVVMKHYTAALRKMGAEDKDAREGGDDGAS